MLEAGLMPARRGERCGRTLVATEGKTEREVGPARLLHAKNGLWPCPSLCTATKRDKEIESHAAQQWLWIQEHLIK